MSSIKIITTVTRSELTLPLGFSICQKEVLTKLFVLSSFITNLVFSHVSGFISSGHGLQYRVMRVALITSMLYMILLNLHAYLFYFCSE